MHQTFDSIMSNRWKHPPSLNAILCKAAQYAPAPVPRMLQPGSSPYEPYACIAQRALLPVAVGAMNIHDIHDRQTDRRQMLIIA